MMHVRMNTPFVRLHNGFTLIELLVVIGIFGVLGMLATTNLLRLQTNTSLNGVVSTYIVDLKEQQIKTMTGGSDGQSQAQQYGIFIGTNSYTLFRGPAYVSSDSNNFVVALDSAISLSTTFPNSQIVFVKASGQISGFVSGSNTVTITNTASGESKVITLNNLGTVIVP